MVYLSHSEEETQSFARELAQRLHAGQVLLLHGEMGAGKTAFVRGLAEGLGCEDPVSSPTFVLMNIYRGRLPLYHFDLYRLGGEDEVYGMGFEEYFEGDGVCAVEWYQIAPGCFEGMDCLKVEILPGEDADERLIRIEEEEA